MIDKLRARLASGDLFPVGPLVWAGRGTGAHACTICDEGITATESASEPRNPPSRRAVVFAHVLCFEFWRKASILVLPDALYL